MPAAGRWSPDRAAFSPPPGTLQSTLASVAVARGTPPGPDHKFLIVPQCTLSAGIGLCDICAKSEQLPAIPLVFPVLPQLRHIAAINAVGSLAVTRRTCT